MRGPPGALEIGQHARAHGHTVCALHLRRRPDLDLVGDADLLDGEGAEHQHRGREPREPRDHHVEAIERRRLTALHRRAMLRCRSRLGEEDTPSDVGTSAVRQDITSRRA